jgi:tetratricopeptide (TPR) repeat protein
MRGRRPVQYFCIYCLFTLVALSLYWHTLDYPFVFDDYQNIVENSHIRITSLNWENLQRAATSSNLHERPVANLSFALNYYFGDYSPRGYRLVNVLLHGLTAFFVYVFCRLTLLLARSNNDEDANRVAVFPDILAGFIAFLWLVHPLQTQSITYIVQRMNSMAVCFYMGALCLYIIGRRCRGGSCRAWCYTGAAAVWLLAMGSKQIAFTGPFVVLLYEWYFFRKLDLAWLKKYALYVVMSMIAATVLGLALIQYNPINEIRGTYRLRDFTMEQRLLTEPRVVIYYVTQLLVPHPSRLNLDHDFTISTSPLTPLTTLPAILALCAALVLAVVIARRDRLLSFCILWFFIHLAIESSFVALEIAFDHRMYMPAVGCLLGIVYGLYRSKAMWRHGYVAAVLAGIVALLFIFWTYQRNLVWSSALTLWEDCARKSPNKARVQNNVGMELAKLERYGEAKEWLQTAVDLDPNYYKAYTNLGIVYAKLGQYDQAIAAYNKALKFLPEDAASHNNLASAYREMGEWQLSQTHYQRAIKANPYHLDAYVGLGNVHMEMSSAFADARSLFEHALTFSPDNPQLYNSIGITYAREKKFGLAQEYFDKALAHGPATAEVLCNLANVHRDTGRHRDAVDYYEKTLAIDSTYVKAAYNAGRMLLSQDEPAAAEKWLRRAIGIQPDHPEAQRQLDRSLRQQGRGSQVADRWIARLNENPRDIEAHLHLGNLYFEQQDYDRAATHYVAIVDIDPAVAVAHFNLGVIAIRRDDLARAHTSLRRTLELQPQYADARAEFVTATNRLAVGLLQAGQVPRAFQYCQAGLKTVNDNAVLHNTMGAIYGQQGKLTLAVESFRRAVELDPEFGDAKRNLAAAEKMLREQ